MAIKLIACANFTPQKKYVLEIFMNAPHGLGKEVNVFIKSQQG